MADNLPNFEGGAGKIIEAIPVVVVKTVDAGGGAVDFDPLEDGATAAQIGAVNETAPGTDTASSGLNGRLQRIAQRLTTIIAALAAALTVRKDQQTVTDCTIANGASLSDAIDLGVYRLVGISIPGSFTGTTLTFQASYDGSTWNNIYDSSGTEKSVTVSTSRRVILSPADFFGVRHVKVRSGTAGSPTAEGGARTLKLIAEA